MSKTVPVGQSRYRGRPLMAYKIYEDDFNSSPRDIEDDLLFEAQCDQCLDTGLIPMTDDPTQEEYTDCTFCGGR